MDAAIGVIEIHLRAKGSTCGVPEGCCDVCEVLLVFPELKYHQGT